MSTKAIKVTCEGAALVPLSSLRNFQGGLKRLPAAKYLLLKYAIEKYGFSFPVYVWRDKRGARQIIDGHQRVLAVRKMIANDGYKLEGGKVPVSWIEARSLREAREKVLLAVSQYGTMSEEGLYEYMTASEIPPSLVTRALDLQTIDLKEFDRKFYGNQDDDGNSDDGGEKAHATAAAKESSKRKLLSKWKVKKGQVWTIPSATVPGGHHVIKCGDSTNWKVVGQFEL